MERSNFALRLLPSLHKAAQRIADREDCSLNQFINLALAEKVAVLDEEYWRNRRNAAKRRKPSDALQFAGDEPPREGDELPEDFAALTPVSKGRRTLKLKAGG
jgi:hypothetical protein